MRSILTIITDETSGTDRKWASRGSWAVHVGGSIRKRVHDQQSGSRPISCYILNSAYPAGIDWDVLIQRSTTPAAGTGMSTWWQLTAVMERRVIRFGWDGTAGDFLAAQAMRRRRIYPGDLAEARARDSQVRQIDPGQVGELFFAERRSLFCSGHRGFQPPPGSAGAAGLSPGGLQCSDPPMAHYHRTLDVAHRVGRNHLPDCHRQPRQPGPVTPIDISDLPDVVVTGKDPRAVVSGASHSRERECGLFNTGRPLITLATVHRRRFSLTAK
jgi:hypothetical protein